MPKPAAVSKDPVAALSLPESRKFVMRPGPRSKQTVLTCRLWLVRDSFACDCAPSLRGLVRSAVKEIQVVPCSNAPGLKRMSRRTCRHSGGTLVAASQLER